MHPHRPAPSSRFVAAAAVVVAAAAVLAPALAGAGRHVGAADGDGRVGFALDGAFGGAVLDMAAHGNRVAALVGQRFWLLEATDAGPHALAHSEPLPGEPMAVAFADGGDFVYVAAGPAGVLVVDAAAGGAPIVRQLPPAPLTGAASGAAFAPSVMDVDVDGTTLYAVGPDRLDVLDVARPDRPVALGSLALAPAQRAVAATPWGAVVVRFGQRAEPSLLTIGAGDRRRPVVLAESELPLGVAPGRLAADARTAIVSSETGAAVVDLADPSLPRVEALDLRVADTFRLGVVDAALVPGPGRQIVAWIRAMDRVNADDPPPFLAWLDVTTSPPRFLRRVTMAPTDAATRLTVLGDGQRVVASDGVGGVGVYGLAVPASGPAGRIGQPWSVTERVDAAAGLDADHLVVLANGTVSVVRRDDGSVVGSVAPVDRRRDLTIVGRWAFALDRPFESPFESDIVAIDLTRRDAPRAVLTTSLGLPIDRLFDGDAWLGAVADDQVTVWPISDPLPADLGAVQLDVAIPLTDGVLDGNVLYAAARSAIVAFDLPEVGNPRIVHRVAATGWPFMDARLGVGGGWLVANEGTSMDILRVDAPSPDAAPSSVITSAFGVDALFDGDRAFVVRSRYGLAPYGLGAVDLATGRELGAIGTARDVDGLIDVARRGAEQLVTARAGPRGVLTWRVVEGGAPTPSTSPSAAATADSPTPASASPSATPVPRPAGPVLYMPFAARSAAPSKGAVTIRPVSTFGGPSRSVIVDGDVAWLSEGRDVVSFDIAPGREPSERTRTPACADMPRGCGLLARGGKSILVVDAAPELLGDGIRIVDVGDPERPRPAGTVSVAGPGSPPGREGLRIVDLAVPVATAPRFVLLTARADRTEVYVIDARDPDHPKVVRALDVPLAPLRLFGQDGALYFVGREDPAIRWSPTELQVWAATPESRLAPIARLLLVDGAGAPLQLVPPTAAALDGDGRLYLHTPDGAIAVVDVSDPRQPVLQDEIRPFAAVGHDAPFTTAINQAANALAVDGPVVAMGMASFAALGIAHRTDAPSDPPLYVSELVAVQTLSTARTGQFQAEHRLAMSHGRAVLAGGLLGGLSVVDGVVLPGAATHTLAGAGSAIGLTAMPPPAADPSLLSIGRLPDVLSRTDMGRRPPVAVRSPFLTALDLARSVPIDDSAAAIDLAFDGRRVWSADSRFGLIGFDVPPDAPDGMPLHSNAFLADASIDAFERIAVEAADRMLWTADPNGGLRVWDATDTGSPRVVWSVVTGGAPEDLALDLGNRRLFVADGPGGLAVYSPGGVVSPRELGRLRLPGSAVLVALDADGRTAWLALENRPGIVQPLGAFGGGRGDTALAAVDVADPSALRLLGAVSLPFAHVRALARTADVWVMSGDTPNPPDSPPWPDRRATTAGLVAVDADPRAPFVVGTWRSAVSEPGYGALASLPDGRIAAAAGEDGIRWFAVDRAPSATHARAHSVAPTIERSPAR